MLEVKGIDVYYGDAQALWGVSLTMRAGEIVTIVGPNGAGKTTLARSIAGILRVAKGSIVIDGQDLSKVPAYEICRHGIALVPEGRRIFPRMTVRDNLELGAYARDARGRVAENLERVYDIFPRLKERTSQLAGTMSGGEQQMLAIGRGLMAHPKVLLLDEPSLGLSPLMVDTIFEVIQRLNSQGLTILLVEQNVTRALQIAHRGYILEEGRIVWSGHPDEMLADDRVKRAYLAYH